MDRARCSFTNMRSELPIAGVREWLKVLLGRRRGLLVDGDSMAPTLRSGQKVLIDSQAAICVGDIVAADHPFRSGIRIVKRLVSIDADGRLCLIGDNPAESTDSRTFGNISPDHLVGKVVARVQ